MNHETVNSSPLTLSHRGKSVTLANRMRGGEATFARRSTALFLAVRSLVLSLTLLCSLSLEGISTADENLTPAEKLPSPKPPAAAVSIQPPEPSITAEQVHEAIDLLAAPQYSVRQKSLDALKSVSADQVALLAEATEKHPDNEVAKRCIELLIRIYATGDRDSGVVRQASDAIEIAANSERWFIAETAQDALERHWKRRVEIAMLQLQLLGGNMSPRDPAKLWERSSSSYQSSPTSNEHLKVFVDEFWKADEYAISLMKRLTPLLNHSFVPGRSRLSFVLIDGHTQTPEEIAQIKGMFGDTNVMSRGQVYLGIVHQSSNADDKGIQIDQIGPESSAAKAGLEVGDKLEKFEGIPLKEFDDLIDLLKTHKVNDEVTFKVYREDYTTPGRRFDVKVKLYGWYERP